MPKRLVKKGVTVVRDGKRIRPEVNKGFDFTADEIDRITAVDPVALGSAKEAASAEEGTAEVASVTTDADTKGGKGDKPAAKPAAAKPAAKSKTDAKTAAKTPDADSDAELGKTDSKGAGSDDDL